MPQKAEKSVNTFWVRAEKEELLPENLNGVGAVILPIENATNLKSAENILKIVELPKANLTGEALKKLLLKAKESEK